MIPNCSPRTNRTKERIINTSIVGNSDRMFCFIEIRSQVFQDGNLLLAGQTKGAPASRRSVEKLFWIVVERYPVNSMIILDIPQDVNRGS